MRQTTKLAVLFLLFCALASAGDAKYDPNWASLDTRPTPQWWQDAKFGIFIHWGVYSVPAYTVKGAYAEWYWQYLNRTDRRLLEFHKKLYGSDFQYQDFAEQFRAELFKPEEWAELFKNSGAKYVVLTSKHHDGFALWQSPQANKTWGRLWNAVDMGPKRDLLGDLAEAVRAKGLRMGIYYSFYEWYNPLWLSDKKRYIEEHMIPQFEDVVTRYKPSVIFNDGEWELPSADWKSEELLAWLFNESAAPADIVINDRWGKETRHKHGGYYTTEYTSGVSGLDQPWEESRGMAYSYGYNRAESFADYRSAREFVLMLADLVSRGGNLLLDIGPRADGKIPPVMEERLIQIGQWLNINGEAIYGTRPWRANCQWSEGTRPELTYGKTLAAEYNINKLTARKTGDEAVIELFFTSKPDALYAIAPNWPGDTLTIKDVTASAQTVVTMFGTNEQLKFTADNGTITIKTPRLAPDQLPYHYGYAFKLTNVK